MTRLQRILADDYLAGLEELSLEEVRERRAECQEVETALSYTRRLVQGRLDIIGAELERRERGEPPSALSELVERLSQGEMLGEQQRPPGLGRLPTYLAPAEAAEEFAQEADAVADEGALGRLPDMTDEEVRDLADRLSAHEREVSDQRRAVFELIDALQGEIVRRYKSGAANVDTLLK